MKHKKTMSRSAIVMHNISDVTSEAKYVAKTLQLFEVGKRIAFLSQNDKIIRLEETFNTT